MRRLTLSVAMLVITFPATARADLITYGTTTIDMDFVTVGNPGNAGEQSRLASHGDATYYGGVDYAYRIGKYDKRSTA